MNKSELVEALAETMEMSKAAADKAVTALTDIIQQTVANGDVVQLTGFGKFSSGERAARTGRNPATGDTIKIPASKTVKFAGGAEFKALVNASSGAASKTAVNGKASKAKK